MAPRLRASENQQKIKYLSTESSDALFFVHNPKCEFFRACNSRLIPSGMQFSPAVVSQNTPRRETKGPQHICIWTTIGSINFCSLSSRMCPMSMRKNGRKKMHSAGADVRRCVCGGGVSEILPFCNSGKCWLQFFLRMLRLDP